MTKGHRRSRKVRKVKEGHGWSFPITRLTFQVRKVMGGGGCVACRIIVPVPAPVPVPFLWTLHFGFGTWIWDLDLGLDLGMTIMEKINYFMVSKSTLVLK